MRDEGGNGNLRACRQIRPAKSPYFKGMDMKGRKGDKEKQRDNEEDKDREGGR